MAHAKARVSAHRVALDLPGSRADQVEQPHIAALGYLLAQHRLDRLLPIVILHVPDSLKADRSARHVRHPSQHGPVPFSWPPSQGRGEYRNIETSRDHRPSRSQTPVISLADRDAVGLRPVALPARAVVLDHAQAAGQLDASRQYPAESPERRAVVAAHEQQVLAAAALGLGGKTQH